MTSNFSGETVQTSFDAYRGLIEPNSLDHPQNQGFGDSAEFAGALNDPNSHITELTIAGKTIYVPQLTPVNNFEWLNADFYRSRFRAETLGNRLLHFSDLIDVEPSPQVEEGLMRLAEGQGVLAFDHPSTDPEYPDRVKAMLGRMGLEVTGSELLGTQTYFAGQVELRHGEDPKAPHIDLLSAFDARIEAGKVDPRDYEDGTTLLHTVDDPELVDALYKMYQDAYVVLNDHPCKQGLSPEEFRDILLHDAASGKLIFAKEGKIETLCLVENNLKKLSWVRWEYYQRKYPDKFANGQIVWFPGIATDPEKQGENNSQNMINLMAELAEEGNNEFIGVFDFCDVNTGFLDRVFESWINAAPQTSIELKPIADQKYLALRLAKS